MASKVYDIVTERIVAELERGTVPWHQPWNAGAGMPRSMSSGKAYRGVNPLLLAMTAQAKGYTSPFWGTYKHIGDLGGQVRKGEKSTLVVFWKRLRVEPSAEERAAGAKSKFVPMLRYFSVFNAAQADDLPARFHPVDEVREVEPIEACEAIVNAYQGPPVVFGGNRACYSPSADLVMIPERSSFTSAEGFYSTLFHELTHSTGHASRLNRPTLLEFHHFGDENYSKEELVAELGAAFLCGTAGIDQVTVPQHAAYLSSWIKALTGDPKLIVQASAQAQRAADLIQGITFAQEDDETAPVAALVAA